MKIRYIATLLLLAVGAVSCKDWLDVYPRSEITSNKVFENEDGFYSALAGLYIKMADDKLYGFDLTCGYLDLMGGAVYMGAGNMVTYQANNYYADPTYGPMVAALQFPAFNYTRGGIRTEKTDATLETIWTKMYNTITNANLLLQELKTTDVAFETGVKELLTGEALAVRAYLHLDLVRLFQPPYLSEQGRTAKRIPYMETLGEGQLFYAYKRRNEERLITLFQVPELTYYFTMNDNRYTPDIPDKEFNAGRTY